MGNILLRCDTVRPCDDLFLVVADIVVVVFSLAIGRKANGSTSNLNHNNETEVCCVLCLQQNTAQKHSELTTQHNNCQPCINTATREWNVQKSVVRRPVDFAVEFVRNSVSTRVGWLFAD